MRKLALISLLAASHVGLLFAQSVQQAVLQTVIYGISSSWAGEIPGCPGVVSNVSAISRSNYYHSVGVVSGSGTWTVALNYSDVSCSGPWTSYGTASQITQSSSPPIAYGNGNHKYIQIAITGNAVVTYTALRTPFFSTGVGAFSFPLTLAQGGTGGTTAATGLANLLSGNSQGTYTNKVQMAGTVSGSAGTPLCLDASGNDTTSGCFVLSFPLLVGQGGTGGTTAASGLANLLNGNSQGTYTNKVQMAGTVSGSAGTPLCLDASGNDTTSGCPGQGGKTSSSPTSFTSAIVGGQAALAGLGTVATSGATVTGTGTSFTTLFSANQPIIVYDTVHSGTGYITSQPSGPDELGIQSIGSIVTFFGGATTTGLSKGDVICSTIYGGTLNNAPGQCWTIYQVVDTYHVTTQHTMYPQVGAGQYACNIVVAANVGYVTCNSPHGLASGANVTIAGTGNSSLNGTYSITNEPAFFTNDPTSSYNFEITTSGVANGFYASDSITLSGVTPTPHLSCSITSNVATCTSLQWPGFTVGDSVYYVNGSTGTCADMNGAHTITGVGTGDYPKTFTFATSGVSNGTCADTAVLIGAGWTYQHHPQRSVVQSVTNNTTLTVSPSFSPDFPAGATYQYAPDNSAAVAAACSLGTSIYMPDGDYHIYTPASAPFHIATCTGFSQEWAMSGGARFVLDNQQNADGFYFEGGTRAKFTNWTVDGLWVWTTRAVVTSEAPLAFQIQDAYYPTVTNFRSTGGTGNVLISQFNDHPLIQGVQCLNVAGCLLSNGDVDLVASDLQVTNSSDESISIHNAPGGIDQERGATVSNFTVKNGENIDTTQLSNVAWSNGLLEGMVDDPVRQAPYNPTNSSISYSNIIIRGGGMAGPQCRWLGCTANFYLGSNPFVQMTNVQILSTNPQSMMGGIVDWAAIGNTSTLQLSNVTISGGPSYGVNAYVNRLEVSNSYFENLDDIGLSETSSGLVSVNGLTLRDVARKWGAGAGSFYGGPNYALALGVTTEFHVRNLTILDDQSTPTGYKIFEYGIGTIGEFDNLTSTITNGALAWNMNSEGNPGKIFVHSYQPQTYSQISQLTANGQIGNGSKMYCSNCTIGACSTSGTGSDVTWVAGAAVCGGGSGGGGGGGSVNVNGSAVTSPNFNGTTPAAASGYQNATFQVSGSNVSAEIPVSTTTDLREFKCLSQLGVAGCNFSFAAGTNQVQFNPHAGLTNNIFGQVDFLGAATGTQAAVVFQTQLSNSWTSVTFDLEWLTTATSGAATWYLQLACVPATGASLDPAWDSARSYTSTAQTTASYSNAIGPQTLTLPSACVAGTPGPMLFGRIYRNGSDTLGSSATASLLSARLTIVHP